MRHSIELDNLHSILEDLNIMLLQEKFDQDAYERAVIENFKKYSFKHFKSISRQAYNILLNYCKTKEDALKAINELKICLVPRDFELTA